MEQQQIFSRMAAVMADIEAIPKGKINQVKKFNYRGIDDVYGSLQPILARHGIFTTPEVLERHREERDTRSGGTLIYTSLRMRYTFWAPDGSSVSCVVEGEGMDTGDTSSNKAMAIAHKYALLQTFCVPTAMDDPDADSHEVLGRAQNDRPHPQANTTMAVMTADQRRRITELRDDPRSHVVTPSGETLSEFLGRALQFGATKNAADSIISRSEALMAKTPESKASPTTETMESDDEFAEEKFFS